MADMTGSCQASSAGIDAENEEKEKEEKLEEIMGRLRAKSHQLLGTWNETASLFKAPRMSMSDRRHQSEVLEKTILHRHLETLQKTFKVTNLWSMVDRLECLAKQVGLKFTSGHSGQDIFISSDMFYVQVLLEASGSVKDVKISHNGDPSTCADVMKALSDGDFTEFQAHLEGLNSIYQINGDKKQRTKSFLALQALENDLDMVAQMQSTISSVSNYIHKSPLGILQPRNGGRPMKLIYFVGPYDLLNEKTKSSHPMTVEAIMENRVGYSLTVAIESSMPHKLQTMPLMTVNKTQDGKSLPSFSAVSNLNSSTIPAVFVLRLERPVPLSLSIIRKIQNITGVEFADWSQVKPLMSLIVAQMTGGKLEHVDNSKGLFVTLPDQQHCYFLNGLNGSADMKGILVTRIPFIHPTNVPAIIVYLRQQLLFNTLIGSCVRSNPKEDLDNSLTFEVTPLALQHVTVTFEHPLRESIATAEFDVTDITNVKCKICTSEDSSICTDDYACKVIQRCLSLPITMRAILRKATGDLDLQILEEPPPQTVPNNVGISKLGQERRQAFIESHALCESRYSMSASIRDIQVPVEPGFENIETPFDPVTVPSDLIEAIKADKISRNPMLASLLDQGNGSPEPQQPSMLSTLLGDQQRALQIPSVVPNKQKKRKKKKVPTATLR